MRCHGLFRPVFHAALLGGLILGATTARAGIKVTTTTVQEIADPTFTYSFTVEIDEVCVLQAGNYLTVFDLFSPPEALALPDHPPTAPSSDWTFLSPATGPSPFGPSPSDTAILNAAWLYTGPTVTLGPIVLGIFTVTIVQDFPKTPEITFVSECGPPGAGTTDGGTVSVTVLPEPATLYSALGGLGLAMLWGVRRRRRGGT